MVNNLPTKARDTNLIPGLGRFSCCMKWQLTPVFLTGKLHGQWSLEGYGPQGHKKLDVTEHAHLCTLILTS